MLRLLYGKIVRIARQTHRAGVGANDARPFSNRRDAISTWLLELLLFFGLAVAATWPLAAHFQSAIPVGQEKVATVPLFNLWTIWWNADRAGELYRGYWDAPVFAPVSHAFALSESQPSTAVVAPIVWMFDSPVTAYNVYLLCVLVANGLTGSLLARSLSGSRLAGVWSGAAMLLLPFVHWQLGVLQLVSLSGVLLTLTFLVRFFKHFKLNDGLLAGAALGFCYLSCNYYGYQLGLVLCFSLPVLVLRRCGVRRLLVGASVGSVLAGLIVLPVVQMQLSLSGIQSWDRRLDMVWRLSASGTDFLRAPWGGPLGNSVLKSSGFPLSPGLACLLVSVVGCSVGLWRRETRRVTAFMGLFVVTAALLSMGPKWIVWGQLPFQHLAAWLPGLSAMRSPFRFAVLVQVGCIVLAGMPFVRKGHDRPNECADEVVCPGEQFENQSHAVSRWRTAIRWIHFVLLCLVLVECWPARPALYTLPDYEQQRPWIEWLMKESHSDDIVANMPFPSGRSVAGYEETTIAMFWGTYHKRRLANGYSGFFPKEFRQLKRSVQNFPDDLSVNELQNAGVRWCVVDIAKLNPSNSESLAKQPLLSLRFATDDDRTRIYEIKRVE